MNENAVLEPVVDDASTPTEPVELIVETEQEIKASIEAKHDAKIRRLIDEALERESEYKDAKEEASDLKKMYDAAIKAILVARKRGPDLQRELPGIDDDDDEPEIDDARMETPIGEAIELTSAMADKLDGLGVATVDDFEWLRAGRHPDYPRGLVDVKGFGEAAITKLENAMLDWLAANQPVEPSECDPENPPAWVDVVQGDDVQDVAAEPYEDGVEYQEVE